MASLIERWEVEQGPSLLGLTEDLFDQEFFDEIPLVLVASGTIDLGLALEGSAVKSQPVTGTVDLGLALEGTASRSQPVTGTVDLGLALEGSAVKSQPVTGTIDLDLTLEGSAAVVSGSTAYLGDEQVDLYLGGELVTFG